jgi:hypothetical protein
MERPKPHSSEPGAAEKNHADLSSHSSSPSPKLISACIHLSLFLNGTAKSSSTTPEEIALGDEEKKLAGVNLISSLQRPYSSFFP